MQPQTLTVIATGIGVCGTLGGIFVGHVLSRSWQREQWFRDKRNEEFRELLAALAESFRLQSTLHAGAVLSPAEQLAMVEALSKTMAVIRSRIFTADVVRRFDLELIWAEASQRHYESLDMEGLARTFAEISARIVSAATEGAPKAK